VPFSQARQSGKCAKISLAIDSLEGAFHYCMLVVGAVSFPQ
jgi:hypothetical protein